MKRMKMDRFIKLKKIYKMRPSNDYKICKC